MAEKHTKTRSAPSNTGDCCFTVDAKSFASSIKSITSACSFGIKTGDKDFDFGDDGSGAIADKLLVIADSEKQRVVLKFVKFSIFVTSSAPASVFKDGAFVVPSAVILALAYRGADATFTLVENTVTVKCGGSRTSFQVCDDPDNIENLKPEGIKTTVELGTDFIKSSIQKVMFASQDTALPAYGMPLRIRCKSGKTSLIAHDNLCAAMMTLNVKNMDDLDVVIPGSALVKAAQACGTDSIRMGIDDSMFRVASANVNVYHPRGQYDVFDVLEYMENEVKSAKPEILVTIDPVGFKDALAAALSPMKIQSKATSNVTILLDSDKLVGNIMYQNDIVSESTARFKIIKMSGSRTKLDTDGPRLLQFIGLMKDCDVCSLRVYDQRIFIANANETTCFVIPER